MPGFGPPHLNPKPGDVVATDTHSGIKTETGVIQAPTEKPVYEAPPSKFNPEWGRTPIYNHNH